MQIGEEKFSKFSNNLSIILGNLIENLVQRRIVYTIIRYLKLILYLNFYKSLKTGMDILLWVSTFK